MVITSQKVIYQKFSHFLLIFLTSPGARHCPALLRRDCNPAPCPLTTKYRHREAVCFHEKYQLVPMSKSQSEFPSLKKLCRALHSDKEVVKKRRHTCLQLLNCREEG